MSYIEVNASVTISYDQLYGKGWHRDHECDDIGKPSPPRFSDRARQKAIKLAADLHREAHPEGPLMIINCQELLCRDLVETIGVWGDTYV